VSLYLPRAFDERDLAHLDALVAEHPLASLVSVVDGEPFVSHVPLLYRRDGQRVDLRGHFARANPHGRHDARVLVVFNGPQAYISPSWYPDKAGQARVPTWNYVVAHLSGTLHVFDDEAALADLVGELSHTHETAVGGTWRFDRHNEAEHVQLRGIVGFRIAVDRIELKAKLSQNHPRANREAVAVRLAQRGDHAGAEMARWMRAVAAPSTPGA
jgi:transcriptional regulator